MQAIFFDFVEPFLDQDYHGMAIIFLKQLSYLVHVKILESDSQT